MNEYEESLRTLMELFGEDIESGMSYEHIHKVIYDNLDNLKELINKQKEEKKFINKYQEAKRYIDMIWSEPSWSRVDIDWSAIEQIKEILDKETPMKPKKNDISNHDQFNNFCSRCGGSLFYKGAGCINNDCRQKIDWSND